METIESLINSLQKFIEQSPLSFLFFILGTLFCVVGLTDGVQGIVVNQNFRLASLVLGGLCLVISAITYYLPPPNKKKSGSVANSRSGDQVLATIPEDLKISLAERRVNLGKMQGEILHFIQYTREKDSKGRVEQRTIANQFNKPDSEIYYRLEQLRLLGFLKKEEIGTFANGHQCWGYSLSSEYQKLIR
jgi:predicted membrane channel-forming protein YqfA (hemolysin III family)